VTAEKARRHVIIARRYAAALITLPALGTLCAILLLFYRGTVEPVTVALFVLFYLLGCIGVEVGFHRYISHRSFGAKKPLRHFLLASGSMAGQGPVIHWTAIHRLHHSHSDQKLDPHSPHVAYGSRSDGFWYAHMGWMFAHHSPNISRIAPDLVRQKDILFYNRTYLRWLIFGILAPAVIGGVIGGPWAFLEGFLWGGLARIFVQHHVTWSINSICHLVGVRAYQTDDRSRNVFFLSLISLGASWHNNHHAHVGSATNDHNWYQLDPGAWFIRGCLRLGQVTRIIDGPRGNRRKYRAMTQPTFG
jgi:stearoyl-CoA desaturase (Delta-9 desaturase)